MAKSRKTVRLFTALLLLGLFAQQASAQKVNLWDIYVAVETIAAALGVLMIAYAGVMWIMAGGPQDRDDAKKTLIYVMVGLLVVALALDIVGAVYCTTMSSTSYGAGIC